MCDGLKNGDLTCEMARLQMPKSQAFGWLQSNANTLSENGIIVRQNTADTKRYFLGYSSLDISIQEGQGLV